MINQKGKGEVYWKSKIGHLFYVDNYMQPSEIKQWGIILDVCFDPRFYIVRIKYHFFVHPYGTSHCDLGSIMATNMMVVSDIKTNLVYLELFYGIDYDR
jgi:hypothetical protein